MLTVGMLLQRSFQVTFQQPGVFFSIGLLIHAPLILFTLFAYQPIDAGEIGLGQVVLLVVASITYVFLLPLQAGAMVYGVLQQLRGEPVTLGECLGAALGRFGSLLGAAILTGLAVMFGLLACIIPGVVIALGLFVVSPIIMVERHLGVVDALKRSWELTNYHKGTIFVFSLVVGILNNILGQIQSRVAIPLAVAVIFLLIQVFFTTVQSVGQGVAYRELRNFKEGTETDELVAVFD